MVFGTLAERFAINPAALGFGQAEFGDGVDDAAISVRELSFSPETDTRTAEIPTLGLLDALQAYTGLTLAVFDGSVDADGNPAATLVDVDLDGSDAVDPAASVADRMAALAALLGNALGPTFTVTTTPANALRVTSSDTSGRRPGPGHLRHLRASGGPARRRLDRRVRDVGRSRLRPGGAFFRSMAWPVTIGPCMS